MKKVRIAQIGINHHSHAVQIFQSLKKLDTVFEIAGYCLVEDEKDQFSKILNRYDGYKELTLEEIWNDETITAVTIETEEKHLTKYAMLAIAHGKHVHMEKPGGTDLAEFESLIAAVKVSGKVFHLGYMYRYNSIITEELQKIREGLYGTIHAVEAQMSCSQPIDRRAWLSGYPGGMMFFLGCHLIDLVLQIKGEPKKVYPFNRTSGLDGITSEDLGLAILEYDDGICFVKTSGVEIGGFERRQLVVTGSKGSFEIKPLEWYTNEAEKQLQCTTCKTQFASGWHTPGNTRTSEGADRYDGMMISFAECVNGIAVNPYTPDYELLLYRTILKCCGIDQ